MNYSRGTSPRLFHVVAVAVLALAPMFVVAPARAHGEPRDVMSADEVLAATGKSIDEWGAAWWQWAFTTPGVLGDTTGEFGPLGNVGGPVFFAEGSGGGLVNLRYKVPGGQYILLPVATYIWTLFDPCAEIDCATRIVNDHFIGGISDAFARIDDRTVHDMASHLVRADPGNPLVFLVDAGPVGEDGYGGILPAVQGGYWIMLRPLSPGMHRMSFGATVPTLDPITGDVLEGSIRLKARLTLMVTRQRKPGLH